MATRSRETNQPKQRIDIRILPFDFIILATLEYSHRALTQADIKPSNLEFINT